MSEREWKTQCLDGTEFVILCTDLGCSRVGGEWRDEEGRFGGACLFRPCWAGCWLLVERVDNLNQYINIYAYLREGLCAAVNAVIKKSFCTLPAFRAFEHRAT